LWIVFPEPPEQGAWTFKKLNKYQKMVLKVLAKNETLWTEEDLKTTDLKDLLDEYSLPNNQKALIKFLQLDTK
jgi:hypothetical protein